MLVTTREASSMTDSSVSLGISDAEDDGAEDGADVIVEVDEVVVIKAREVPFTLNADKADEATSAELLDALVAAAVTLMPVLDGLAEPCEASAQSLSATDVQEVCQRVCPLCSAERIVFDSPASCIGNHSLQYVPSAQHPASFVL